MTRLLLADEFFLTAHDEETGKPRQHPRVVSFGLAAGLLAELMLVGRITTHQGAVVVIKREPPSDALAHTVLDHLIAERQPHPPRTWLTYLAQSAVERVAARLERTGDVARVETRRLLRSEARWVPTDKTVAATPSAVLRHQLQYEKPLELPDAVLAGLVDASGLDQSVLWGMTARTMQYRDWCVANLPVPLRELLAETKAAVGNAVLTHRA